MGASGEVVPVAPPDDAEAGLVLARVLKQSRKDWEALGAAWPQDEYEELQQRAVQERLALGEAPRRHRRSRVAVSDGFSDVRGHRGARE